MTRHPDYLRGLNTVRFFAAFFVILSHGHQSLVKLGSLQDHGYAVFDRGGAAVELFFTLSGFLITYLMLLEIRRTGTVDIGFFYFRRIIRIWPLYFLCLASGLLLLGWVFPRLTGQTYFEGSVARIACLFVLFLPNLAASYYKVGLLFPLWSIGIEEQFYLFWAPLVRRFQAHLRTFLGVFLLVSTAWYVAVNCIPTDQVDPRFISFCRTMKYHDMAAGALFAYVLHYGMGWYTRSVFSRPVVQVLAPALVLYHYLVGITVVPNYVVSLGMSFVYGIIFLNISSLEHPVFDLEMQPFKYLGEISYGLYMYHMYVDYFLRMVAARFLSRVHFLVGSIAYLVLLLALTIAVAAFSYRFFERYFLSLRRLYRRSPRTPTGNPHLVGLDDSNVRSLG